VVTDALSSVTVYHAQVKVTKADMYELNSMCSYARLLQKSWAVSQHQYNNIVMSTSMTVTAVVVNILVGWLKM